MAGGELAIDGVIFEFMNTPFAEAPAEMMFYLPQMKAFYAAEEANARPRSRFNSLI